MWSWSAFERRVIRMSYTYMCLLEMVNLRKSTFNVNLSRAETIPLKNSSRFHKGKIPIKGPIKRATRISCSPVWRIRNLVEIWQRVRKRYVFPGFKVASDTLCIQRVIVSLVKSFHCRNRTCLRPCTSRDVFPPCTSDPPIRWFAILNCFKVTTRKPISPLRKVSCVNQGCGSVERDSLSVKGIDAE